MANIVASGLANTACHAVTNEPGSNDARLTARPSSPQTSPQSGTRTLGLGASRDGVIRVPADARGALPLIVLLHGASGSGEGFLESLAPALESLPAVIVAPDSAGRTWDAVNTEPQTLLDVVTGRRRFSGFGRDVKFLDKVLEHIFSTIAIDPERISVAGFSDGATYALSLGLINGDLFRKIIAFSPGFFFDRTRAGEPRVFVSHGRADRILPIDRTGRRVVAELRQRSYEVIYREFDGGHHVPDAIAREALDWAIR